MMPRSTGAPTSIVSTVMFMPLNQVVMVEELVLLSARTAMLVAVGSVKIALPLTLMDPAVNVTLTSAAPS